MGDIKSLKFGAPKRKRFSVDGDESRVIEIDTGDTGIVTRWAEIEPWFKELQNRLEIFTAEAVESDSAVLGEMATLDKDLREKLNILFDSDVCTPIVGEKGSLIRSVDGVPIFYTIIETLIPLYEQDIKVEAAKAQKRVEKHTAKYTRK